MSDTQKNHPLNRSTAYGSSQATQKQHHSGYSSHGHASGAEPTNISDSTAASMRTTMPSATGGSGTSNSTTGNHRRVYHDINTAVPTAASLPTTVASQAPVGPKWVKAQTILQCLTTVLGTGALVLSALAYNQQRNQQGDCDKLQLSQNNMRTDLDALRNEFDQIRTLHDRVLQLHKRAIDWDKYVRSNNSVDHDQAEQAARELKDSMDRIISQMPVDLRRAVEAQIELQMTQYNGHQHNATTIPTTTPQTKQDLGGLD